MIGVAGGGVGHGRGGKNGGGVGVERVVGREGVEERTDHFVDQNGSTFVLDAGMNHAVLEWLVLNRLEGVESAGLRIEDHKPANYKRKREKPVVFHWGFHGFDGGNSVEYRTHFVLRAVRDVTQNYCFSLHFNIGTDLALRFVYNHLVGVADAFYNISARGEY